MTPKMFRVKLTLPNHFSGKMDTFERDMSLKAISNAKKNTRIWNKSGINFGSKASVKVIGKAPTKRSFWRKLMEVKD